nr:immunoglobulin heavy chain junction region [Mus musculus]
CARHEERGYYSNHGYAMDYW